MAGKTKRLLYKVKERLQNLFGRGSVKKETLERRTYSKFSCVLEIKEKRRKEAAEFLVRKYYESKRREEELRKKLESMGKVRRWVYKRITDFKDYSSFFKDAVGTPVGLVVYCLTPFMAAIVTSASIWRIAPLIELNVPFPLNYAAIFITATGLAFSPFIISLEIYDYRETKRKKKRLREEYGIEV